MGINGLDQVPSPPALDDLYDDLKYEAGEAEAEGWWVAGAISLALSVYGFWVGFAAIRSWFSPGPFCSPECRRGILYAMVLLVPACLGVVLGLALIKGRNWAPPMAFAAFGAFALENLVRADLDFGFTYPMLFLVMFLVNLGGIAALVWGGRGWNPLSASREGLVGVAGNGLPGESAAAVDGQQEAGTGYALVSGRVVHPKEMGLEVQKAAPEGNVTPSRAEHSNSCRIAAAILLILAMAWYRIPDSLFRKDFLGVFSLERPPIPRWLAESPAISAFVLWGFVLATAILISQRWARIMTLVTAMTIAGMCFAYLPSASNPWLRAECLGLILLNGALVVVLLAPKCR